MAGVKFAKAKSGKKFVLTASGGAIPRIRAKYEVTYERKFVYEKTVPQSWIDNGYVREVENGEK